MHGNALASQRGRGVVVGGCNRLFPHPVKTEAASFTFVFCFCPWSALSHIQAAPNVVELTLDQNPVAEMEMYREHVGDLLSFCPFVF